MANSLAFYVDSGLTARSSSIAVTQADDGSTGPVDQVLYLGSPLAGRQFQAASNPGVNAIRVSIEDGAGGLPATAVRLAATAAGLDGAVPGEGLDVGATILSGAAGAVPVHIRFDAAGSAAPGRYTDLALTTNTVMETAT